MVSKDSRGTQDSATDNNRARKPLGYTTGPSPGCEAWHGPDRSCGSICEAVRRREHGHGQPYPCSRASEGFRDHEVSKTSGMPPGPGRPHGRGTKSPSITVNTRRRISARGSESLPMVLAQRCWIAWRPEPLTAFWTPPCRHQHETACFWIATRERGRLEGSVLASPMGRHRSGAALGQR